MSKYSGSWVAWIPPPDFLGVGGEFTQPGARSFLSGNTMLLPTCWGGKRRNNTKRYRNSPMWKCYITAQFAVSLSLMILNWWLTETGRRSISAQKLLITLSEDTNGLYWFSQFSGPTFNAMRNGLWLQIPLTKLVTEIRVPHMCIQASATATGGYVINLKTLR